MDARSLASRLECVADGVWSVPAPLRFVGVKVDTRMTVLRLGDGGVLLVSPVAYDEALAQEVEALGPVRGIVAPNALHHLYIGGWMRAYPEARSDAAAGVAKKHPELSFSGVLGSAFDEAFGADVARFSVEGMPRLNESLLLHRASRTLVATDLCFFLPRARGLTRVFAAVMGIRGRPRVELAFRALIRDHGALRRSLAPLRNERVAHLSMCHHEVVSHGAHEAFQGVLDQLAVPPHSE